MRKRAKETDGSNEGFTRITALVFTGKIMLVYSNLNSQVKTDFEFFTNESAEVGIYFSKDLLKHPVEKKNYFWDNYSLKTFLWKQLSYPYFGMDIVSQPCNYSTCSR